MKKLTSHCGEVEAEINLSEKTFEKLRRCNCSICKRKGAVMAMIETKDLKVTKGEDKISVYKYHTNVAEHYFCKNCGIYTHHKMRSNPNMYGFNIGCVEGVDPFSFKNIDLFDGTNHPLDQKK